MLFLCPKSRHKRFFYVFSFVYQIAAFIFTEIFSFTGNFLSKLLTSLLAVLTGTFNRNVILMTFQF